MKAKLLISIFVVCTFSLQAQQLVVDTAFTTDPGFGGAPASCIFTGGTVYGFTSSTSTGYTIADDFTVPTGQTWRLDSVRVYAYQTGSSTISTFTNGLIKIWQGRPDSAGAQVVYRDTVNAFVGTKWTGVYRVSSTSLTNTQRPVMFITLDCGGTVVNQGVYWIEYWLTGSLSSGPFTPPKVLPGRINPPGQNARQRTISSNTWAAALDGSTPTGVNFIVIGQNITGISSSGSELPITYSLNQNHPNPFNPVTKITYQIPKSGNVNLIVTDVLGREVAVLVNEFKPAGYYEIDFNASALASGVYFYSITAGDFKDTKKMQLVK